eukprot:scaffold279589_cov64-Attheya_sp.AAC.1
MDAVLQSTAIATKDYATLNYCRLYLRVTTLSDITTSDGTQIKEDILTGFRDLSQSIDSKDWPHQEKPDKATWTKWEKMIREVFCNFSTYLKKPLGKWTEQADTTSWKF